MSAIQNLLQHAVTIDGVPVPFPTELDPYEWTDVPPQFNRVRGFGGAVTYKITALDCGFSITCKSTDLTYSFLSALKIQKEALALAGADPRFVISWIRGDTGETWIGTGCSFNEIPAGKSSEQPTVVTWTFNVEVITINPPSPSILPPGI